MRATALFKSPLAGLAFFLQARLLAHFIEIPIDEVPVNGRERISPPPPSRRSHLWLLSPAVAAAGRASLWDTGGGGRGAPPASCIPQENNISTPPVHGRLSSS